MVYEYDHLNLFFYKMNYNNPKVEENKKRENTNIINKKTMFNLHYKQYQLNLFPNNNLEKF